MRPRYSLFFLFFFFSFFYTKKNSIEGRRREATGSDSVGRWTGGKLRRVFKIIRKYEGMKGDASDFAEGILTSIYIYIFFFYFRRIIDWLTKRINDC